MTEFTDIDLGEIERERDLPPDELYERPEPEPVEEDTDGVT